MEIKIKNCNNITSGELSIIEGRLNIKYAINGTGKSTIAHALEFATLENRLNELLPYKYLDESPLADEHIPTVECSAPLAKVSIFNENYVNQYMFLPDELLANSFEIFVKTQDYDLQMENIQRLIDDIQFAFQNNPDLDDLIAELTTFISGFGKAQSGYSKAGSIGKGLAQGNKIVNVPAELIEYTPYIQSEKNASWLTWQSKGQEYLDVAEKCPYCAGQLLEPQRKIVKQLAVEYDSKYVAELQKMVKVLQSLNSFFTEDVRDIIIRLANSVTAFTKEEINFLIEIKNQVEVLNNRLIEIRALNFGSLKDVDKVIAALESKRINLSLLGHINSDYTHEKISPVNDALDNVIKQANYLQGEINKQKKLIEKTIRKYNKEINGFLESAGYNYNVSIDEDASKDSYRMVLYSTDATTPISNAKLHLSYGEKNAFALVLFMYRALKEQPDLIILDDPISSFDKNKKYAIMERLFQGAGSFQDKTVIMLTHDFDPIVDLIHTPSIRCRFNPVPMASFLCNKNGILTEAVIRPEDVKSFYEIANINIQNATDEINKLIYLRRRLEACGDKGLAWQLLSNIFHPNRTAPVLSDVDGIRPMSECEIAEASVKIQEEIPNFEYERVYTKAYDTAQMIQLYHTLTSNYEKIQIYRMINHGQISDTIFKKFVDEAYHIENDSLFQLDPSQFPTIPDYIVQLCDNGIEILEANLNNIS